jgi:hypothetical protein
MSPDRIKLICIVAKGNIAVLLAVLCAITAIKRGVVADFEGLTPLRALDYAVY